MTASVGPHCGDQFVIASGAASTRRAARNLPVATVGSWPAAARFRRPSQLPFNLGGAPTGRFRAEAIGSQLTVVGRTSEDPDPARSGHSLNGTEADSFPQRPRLAVHCEVNVGMHAGQLSALRLALNA